MKCEKLGKERRLVGRENNIIALRCSVVMAAESGKEASTTLLFAAIAFLLWASAARLNATLHLTLFAHVLGLYAALFIA